MNKRWLFLVCTLSVTIGAPGAQAVEWEEHLVTASDSKMISLGERKVMGYYGTGAGLLVHGDSKVPLGSYACAGMVDIAGDGTSVHIECTVSAPDGGEVYLSVRREKSDSFAAGTGVYHYTGGTGAWADFQAECSYEVSYMPSKIHGVEVAHCTGDTLPPPLR